MGQGPKLFSCPKCRHRYLGHDPLPDCTQSEMPERLDGAAARGAGGGR